MTDRLPPVAEDHGEKALRERATVRIHSLVDRGIHICSEFVPVSDSPVSCGRCGYTSDVHLVRDLVGELSRLHRERDLDLEHLKCVDAMYRKLDEHVASETARADFAESRLSRLQDFVEHKPGCNMAHQQRANWEAATGETATCSCGLTAATSTQKVT